MLQPPSIPQASEPPAAKPAAPAPTQRRRSAIDTLVARDQTAVFWFLVACAVAAGCAWYLVIMAEALKARPPFVVMDTSGAYYVAPGINYDTREPLENPMHVAMTRLAVETIFERGPLGLTHNDRRGKLFNKSGDSMLEDIIKKEDPYFVSQKVEQSVELLPASQLGTLPPTAFPKGVSKPSTNPAVIKTAPTAAATWAVGIVTRRSVFKGQPQVEYYRFKLILVWRLNPDMRANGAYPSVVDQISTYNLEKISDS